MTLDVSHRSRSFRSEAYARDVYYVYAPPYTHLSGGPIALHRLCHHLNELGHEAYIYTPKLSGFMHTPLLTEAVYQAHAHAGRRKIAIYPEVVVGNPLRCDRIVRYLLNKPGARSGNPAEAVAFWQHPDRQSEFHWHFADEFQVNYLPSTSLFIPIVDRGAYRMPELGTERAGFLLYAHRVRFTDEAVPAWARPYTTIDIQNPKTPPELAQLYQRSKGLVVFERTGAIHEALFCGCPSVCIPNDFLRDFPMARQFGNVGVGWGNRETDWLWALQSQQAFRNIYDTYSVAFPIRLAAAVEDALAFFDRTPAAPPRASPAPEAPAGARPEAGQASVDATAAG